LLWGCTMAPARRALFLVVLVALCVPRLAAAQVPDDSTPKERRIARPTITEVTFTGLHAFEKGTLLAGIATTASHCKSALLTPFCWVTKSPLFYQKTYLDRIELARDLLRIKIFYWEHGYHETGVDSAVSPEGAPAVRVTFRVREGPPIIMTAIAFEPDSLFLPRQRARLLRVHVGAPLDLLAIDSSRTRILDALWRRGYADAVVDTSTVVDPVARTAAVTFTADPKKKAIVGGIHVRGNTHIDSTTIRHGLELQPGHPLFRNDVTDGQRALYKSNLFTRASITFAPDSTGSDSVKQVLVVVQEAPHHSFQVSGGFNQINFVQLGARYLDYNWLGDARQLDINGSLGNILANQLDNVFPFYDVTALAHKGDSLNTGKYLQLTWEASVKVTQPWFGDPLNSVSVGVFDHRRSFPGIYVDNGYGAQGSFTRELAEHLVASLTYRYELTQVSASQVYFCVNYGACDLPTISLLQERRSLSPLALSVTWDQSTGGLSPVNGYVVRAELQHASQFTLSDYRYNRAYGWGSYYYHLGHRSVLAFHAEAGWVGAIRSGIDTGALHPRTRFYAGGAQSVRGFGENQLGPEVLTVAPSALQAICGTAINPATCNPNTSFFDPSQKKDIIIPNSAFTPRPLGGTTLLEGSVEYRYPIVGNLGGAAFVDAGFLGQNTFNFATSGEAAATPGMGLRYYTVVGPIRLDLGFNPWSSRSLPVVTQIGTGRTASIVELAKVRPYTPPGLLSVFVLHLSIGQAF